MLLVVSGCGRRLHFFGGKGRVLKERISDSKAVHRLPVQHVGWPTRRKTGDGGLTGLITQRTGPTGSITYSCAQLSSLVRRLQTLITFSDGT